MVGGNLSSGVYYSLAWMNGKLWAGGSQVLAVDLICNKLSIWNGGAWVNPDIYYIGGSVRCVTVDQNENVYVGSDGTATAFIGDQYDTYNYGSKSVYPVAVFKRTGGTSARVVWLENQTTGKRVYLNYYLQDGEELRIDFRPGKRDVVSSLYGKRRWEAILGGSDFNEFVLIPGNNVMQSFVDIGGGATTEIYMIWERLDWQADDVG
jgi:hypothetical protein